MLIQELLSSKVLYDVVTESASTFKTIAKIGDRFITFSALKDYDDSWNIGFYEEKDHRSSRTYAKTGSGDELKVFAMIKSSLEEFIQRYDPTVITFSADKDGESDTRAHLYAKLGARYLKGWEAEKIDTGKTTHFRYTKDGLND